MSIGIGGGRGTTARIYALCVFTESLRKLNVWRHGGDRHQAGRHSPRGLSVVEKDRYTNIRRITKILYQVKQRPGHHAQAARNSQKAKDERNKTKTDDEVDKAVFKVKTL